MKGIRSLFKNFFYVIISNLVSVFISILVLLVIPKFIGVVNYGYWQLYVFYTAYVGFLHFGINDGLYLRLGGAEYKEVDKKLYFSQFYLLLSFQLSIALLVISFLFFFDIDIDINKIYIIYMTVICMVIVNVRYMLLFLLQATYKIKQYSVITISDRLMYLILVVSLVVFDEDSYKFFIFADLLGKLFSLLLACFYCKDLVWRALDNFKFKLAIQELIINAKVGVKLMFSNVAGKLVVGNVRLGIEAVWSVIIFGKISLMLSVTSFLMIFINSVSLVLFPFLRRVEESSLSFIYTTIRDGLSIFLLIFLLFYYPIYLGLNYWLPDYQDALDYLYILFPVVIFEGKMSLLINTYLKVLRKEALLLKVNLIAVSLSVLVTLITTYLLNDLELAIYGILFLISVRVFIFEMYIQKILSVKFLFSSLIELFIVVLFLIFNKYLALQIAFYSYLILLFASLYFKRNDVSNLISLLKNHVVTKSAL